MARVGPQRQRGGSTVMTVTKFDCCFVKRHSLLILLGSFGVALVCSRPRYSTVCHRGKRLKSLSI